ncbi:MAG: cryptochrome/photolyase family protein [Hyphomicrobium sp.]
MASKPIILWFRNDLRLTDHRALHAAVSSGLPILPVYIYDLDAYGSWKPGGASRWWLHWSLQSLMKNLEELGASLVLKSGVTEQVLASLAEEVGAGAVYFSRAYEPWACALEKKVLTKLSARQIECKRYASFLLREPEEVKTKAGDTYKVYTPFWRAHCGLGAPSRPLPSPPKINMPKNKVKSQKLLDWKLLPSKPNWAISFKDLWQPGEEGAHQRLSYFIENGLQAYKDQRNFPAIDGTSRLSPHLHFGEISPHVCWYRASEASRNKKGSDQSLETYLKELVWREFSYNLLMLCPTLPEHAFKNEFENFPWSKNKNHLKAWEKGLTGYPIVDAGMRELWQTGYMHNRVRMIAASFLVKHLLIPWQSGEAWFWDTLVDADLASNAASWQWVAGSGADAAPYFRIFNPVTQGEKFDPEAHYVKKWVPEISRLPLNVIHAPWTATSEVLSFAKVELGKTYPHPIVDHNSARQKALDGYARIRNSKKA